MGGSPLEQYRIDPVTIYTGGSQNGMIFYSSFAREYEGAPAATMTIELCHELGKVLLGGNPNNKSIYFKKVTLDHNGRILWVNLDINGNTITFQ